VVYPNAPLTLLAFQYLVKKCLIVEQRKENSFFSSLFLFSSNPTVKNAPFCEKYFCEDLSSESFFPTPFQNFFSSHRFQSPREVFLGAATKKKTFL